ncbi:MAG: histidine--tRNA ligase [Melioribacteraceae bacterium]|nr:histidine--tRNA ligase [Melioribacteraceae bacterium]
MIKAIKGTKDILPSDMPLWHFLEENVRNTMREFNYSEIRTPVFEETRLFARSIGESTDIVGKEMYTFTDKSENSVTLRPEMTASVVRAYIENSLDRLQPLHKLFYIAPMFRQERPQAGRLRQFHQFGAEALGSSSPLLDAEMIILGYNIIKSMGLTDLAVKINSLGIPSSRENYKNILKDYLSPKLKELSEESQKRFETNILRIFDSKNEKDAEIMNDAPVLLDHLDDESLESFEQVKTVLDASGIPYQIDPKLVRGLDYYTNTTFEILSGSVGSQSALCGGGRYDLLAEQLGGKASPGVGFAAGMERILLACQNENSIPDQKPEIDVYIANFDKSKISEAYNFANKLRGNGFSVESDYLSRSIKAQLREANKNNARFVVFYGGEELAENKIQLKNMTDGEQANISLDSMDSIIEKIRG